MGDEESSLIEGEPVFIPIKGNIEPATFVVTQLDGKTVTLTIQSKDSDVV